MTGRNACLTANLIGKFLMRRAFTLIELLVVVSIIALLVAILLPVLSNAKYSVRTTQCASRLKQIGIAATAYATDSNGRYPHKIEPGSVNFLNPQDGELYREDRKPWVIRTSTANVQFDYVPLIEPYVSDVSEIFICPHMDFDWGDAYQPATSATEIPYAMYWGIVRRNEPGTSRAVLRPMVELGEGFGPANNLIGGGVTFDSRYRILASDKVRRDNAQSDPDIKHLANHPPTGSDYQEPSNASNGKGWGYEFSENATANANYLYDDGSVVLYGRINKDTIGKDAEDEFRNAEWWLAPTDRVE